MVSEKMNPLAVRVTAMMISVMCHSTKDWLPGCVSTRNMKLTMKVLSS